MKVVKYIFCVVFLVSILIVLTVGAVAKYVYGKTFVDTEIAQETIFQSDAKLAVYSTPRIANTADKPHVVVLGPSNTRQGFRPLELSSLLEDTPVHNVSVGGQTVQSLTKLVDLLYQQMPLEKRKNLIFVLGIWPRIFENDQYLGLDEIAKHLNREMERYSLFKIKKDDEVEFKLPDVFLSTSLQSVWPLMVPYALYSASLRSLLRNNFIPLEVVPPDILPWYVFAVADRNKEFSSYDEQNALNNVVLTQEKLSHDIKAFDNHLKALNEWGYLGLHDLENMASLIHQQGGRLIVIDMPILSIARRLPSYSVYQQKIKNCIAILENQNLVQYKNLQSSLDDSEFYDIIHIRPKGRYQISQFSSRTILPILHQFYRKNSQNAISNIKKDSI
jgi:hypothetical protein